MRCRTIILEISVLLILQAGALANCPSGYPNEIFCDDFDTYCASPEGGFPGDPKNCTSNSVDNNKLRSVWPKTSNQADADTLDGVDMKAEDAQNLINSPFLGCRQPKGDLGQATVRDWVLSPALPGATTYTGKFTGQVMDIHRFVGNVFGPSFNAVTGTDNPNGELIMEFFMAADVGKLYQSNSYMELGFGPPNDPMNRANTDYALSPTCRTYCSPTIDRDPFPIMCAQANPLSPPTLPAGCPNIATAPVHNALAVGQIADVDTDPCHCGSTLTHFPQNSHLLVFDGQAWWVLRSGNPPGTGTATPTDGGPATPPSDIVPGGFVLSSPPVGTKSSNFVRMIIKANTITIELTALLLSGSAPNGNGFKYSVFNTVTIPRKYTGPFNRISMGVGPACELNDNTSWSTCKTGTDRRPLLFPYPQSQTYFTDYDDFVLHGGEGFTIAGSCCHNNGTCTEVGPGDCQASGDIFGGSNTQCSNTTCCSHGTYVWADSDADGDVDADDFGKFQRCYTGFESMLPDLKCKCFDRPHAGTPSHVDGSDYQEFVNCETGAGVPWFPSSPAGCVQ